MVRDCQALAAVTETLPTALGGNFQALYLYEGATRCLWLLVRSGTDMQGVREAFLPLWKQHSDFIGRGPFVISAADWDHYRLLNPWRASYLCEKAQLLAGEDVWARQPELSPGDPLFQLGHIAAETVRCCRLLENGAPQVDLKRELHQVVAQEARLNLDGSGPALDLLGALYAYLEEHSAEQPSYGWDGISPSEPAPPLLPGLLALVGLRDQLIAVMPIVNRSILDGTDWSAVARLVSDDFAHVGMATPWQLRLAASTALAQDLYLSAFEHLWGSDVLYGCEPAEKHVLRSAAELPVDVLVEQLSPLYMTVDEEALGDLIHTVQNYLLNIQLRSELTARLKGVPAESPSEPLPDRDAGPHERIAANYSHLRWWADHLVARWQAL